MDIIIGIINFFAFLKHIQIQIDIATTLIAKKLNTYKAM